MMEYSAKFIPIKYIVMFINKYIFYIKLLFNKKYKKQNKKQNLEQNLKIEKI
jgi:hypothetical protein